MKNNQYPLKELVKRWEREELTVEQAIGQILLWLDDLSEQIAQLETNRKVQPKQSRSEGEMVTLDEVSNLWRLGQITPEIAIGYLVRDQIKQQTALTAANISWAKIRSDLDRLVAHTGLKPEPTRSKKPPKSGKA